MVAWTWHMESRGAGGTATVTCSWRGQSKTATTGFSPQSSTILQPALLLLAVFVVGTYVSMWRKDTRSLGDDA